MAALSSGYALIRALLRFEMEITLSEERLKSIIDTSVNEALERQTQIYMAKGLLRPQSNVLLNTRKQQAAYLGMATGTFKLRILPLIKHLKQPSRSDLDKAKQIYLSKKKRGVYRNKK
ncbi:MAG: hypothetical protein AAFX93_18715 [Verrucomicrobiota bacterium]